MSKDKMIGYFKPATPNKRAWCPKRKQKPKGKQGMVKNEQPKI